eukprot:942839_1
MDQTQTDYSYQFQLALFEFPFKDFLSNKTPINTHPLNIDERQELIRYHTVEQAVRILNSYDFLRALTPTQFIDYFGLHPEPTLLTSQYKQELLSDYFIIKLNSLTTVELLERFYENGTYTEFDLAEPLTIQELRNSIIKCLLAEEQINNRYDETDDHEAEDLHILFRSFERNPRFVVDHFLKTRFKRAIPSVINGLISKFILTEKRLQIQDWNQEQIELIRQESNTIEPNTHSSSL